MGLIRGNHSMTGNVSNRKKPWLPIFKFLEEILFVRSMTTVERCRTQDIATVYTYLVYVITTFLLIFLKYFRKLVIYSLTDPPDGLLVHRCPGHLSGRFHSLKKHTHAYSNFYGSNGDHKMFLITYEKYLRVAPGIYGRKKTRRDAKDECL